jgi:hypothetical protein
MSSEREEENVGKPQEIGRGRRRKLLLGHHSFFMFYGSSTVIQLKFIIF